MTRLPAALDDLHAAMRRARAVLAELAVATDDSGGIVARTQAALRELTAARQRLCACRPGQLTDHERLRLLATADQMLALTGDMVRA